MSLSSIRSSYCNIPASIEARIGRNLHLQHNHPIEIVKRKILNYLNSSQTYTVFEDLSPFVSVEDNFDKLLIPPDHSARGKTDTYYINETTVLRTHTSAHQNQLLAQGHTSFIVIGDVYRKDEVDRCHFPVFHQLELLSIIDENKDPQTELTSLLSGLIEHLFPKCQVLFQA